MKLSAKKIGARFRLQSLVASIAITCLFTGSPVAAEIYKIVDARGNVSYTDKPPRDLDNGTTATTMKIKLRNSYKPTSRGGRRQASTEENDGVPPIPGSDIYQNLTITAPAAEASLRSNSGAVTLSASLAPSLRPGHKLRFFLDGRPVGTITGTSLAVTDVPRGQHSVAAIVVDIENRPLKNSEIINFTLQRFTPNLPASTPKPPANRPNSSSS